MSVTAEEFNRLRGRICGLIESWGVPERQERAMIATFKALTYDAQKKIEAQHEDELREISEPDEERS